MTKRVRKDAERKGLGTRSKLTGDFIEALEADWRQNGEAVIQKLRVERPEVYARLIADLVPRQIETGTAADAFADMSAAQLENYLAESFATDLAQGDRIMAKARLLAASSQDKDDDPIVTIIPDEAA